MPATLRPSVTPSTGAAPTGFGSAPIRRIRTAKGSAGGRWRSASGTLFAAYANNANGSRRSPAPRRWHSPSCTVRCITGPIARTRSRRASPRRCAASLGTTSCSSAPRAARSNAPPAARRSAMRARGSPIAQCAPTGRSCRGTRQERSLPTRGRSRRGRASSRDGRHRHDLRPRRYAGSGRDRQRGACRARRNGSEQRGRSVSVESLRSATAPFALACRRGSTGARSSRPCGRRKASGTPS